MSASTIEHRVRDDRRGVVGVAVLALLALLVTAPPAAAQAGEGLIAFDNVYDEEAFLRRIEVMAPDGSGRRVLTEGHDPALPEDGSVVAFVRDGDIWVHEIATGAESQITSDPVFEGNPAWSPDGSLLAFTRVLPAGSDCTHVVNSEVFITDFADELQFTDDPCFGDSSPDFSPDGTGIAWHSFFAERDFSSGFAFINVADLATGASTIITDPVDDVDALDPAWSPDGGTIAFTSLLGGLYTVDADGGDQARLITETPTECSGFDDPDWSPDGRIVATISCDEDSDGITEEDDLAVVDPAGGAITSLTGPDGQEGSPSWSPAAGGGSPSPGPVSPGGARLDGGGRVDPVGQAIAVSQELFADGSADRVVVATSDRFPDALAGAALAGTRGPVLVTPSGAPLDPRVEAEIARVTGGQGVALILGGVAAVGEGAAATARAAAGSGSCSAPVPVDCRYAGSGREATAALIAGTVVAEHGGDRVLLARGDAFADAITGGAFAAAAGVPILLTPPDQLNAQTRAFIEGNGIAEVVVLGGVAAVSQATADAVPASVSRVSGADRTATSAAVATELWQAEGLAGGGVVVVNVRAEDGWQTALSGAVLSAVRGSPQLGVETPPAAPTAAVLDAAAALGGPVIALGGADLVDDGQLAAIRSAAGS